MRIARKVIPVVMILILCAALLLSHRQVVIEFNTGMPVQNIEGLRNALNGLVK